MTTITRYTKGFVRYLRNNRAVSALEYAILVGIIAVAISAALVAFAPNITKAIISRLLWRRSELRWKPL